MYKKLGKIIAWMIFLTIAWARGENNEACLACHEDKSASLTFKGGESLSVFVDAQAFERSAHGAKIACSDCHASISLDNHPTGEISFKTKREYTLAMYDVCKKCHFANYTKLLESVHYELLSQGKQSAPTCVDCHGYHEVEKSSLYRPAISKKCAQCHEAVYRTYAQSVHGKSLLEANNHDAPVCTDCHKSHNIQDPRTTQFRIHIPSLCGGCHANEKLMKKYNLSTKVLETYLNEFHGISISLYQKENKKNNGAGKSKDTLTAVCTDCHGIHNITKTDGPNASTMKHNLAKSCQKCHPNASDTFPNTWLSHYEPNLSKAPLVYLVTLFYKVLIPFIIGGLILHILLHAWRLAVNR